MKTQGRWHDAGPRLSDWLESVLAGGSQDAGLGQYWSQCRGQGKAAMSVGIKTVQFIKDPSSATGGTTGELNGEGSYWTRLPSGRTDLVRPWISPDMVRAKFWRAPSSPSRHTRKRLPPTDRLRRLIGAWPIGSTRRHPESRPNSDTQRRG
jgi:hypothetical protein